MCSCLQFFFFFLQQTNPRRDKAYGSAIGFSFVVVWHVSSIESKRFFEMILFSALDPENIKVVHRIKAIGAIYLDKEQVIVQIQILKRMLDGR